MRLSHHVDEARNRLTLTFSGDVSARLFGEYVLELYRSRPELFDYDCVTDLRDYRGTLSNPDLSPLLELYAAHVRRREAPSRSFFVTPDPAFGFWASALDHYFPGRVHAVVGTVEEANRRLDEAAGVGNPTVERAEVG
jgi:hypothetical protein